MKLILFFLFIPFTILTAFAQPSETQSMELVDRTYFGQEVENLDYLEPYYKMACAEFDSVDMEMLLSPFDLPYLVNQIESYDVTYAMLWKEILKLKPALGQEYIKQRKIFIARKKLLSTVAMRGNWEEDKKILEDAGEKVDQNGLMSINVELYADDVKTYREVFDTPGILAYNARIESEKQGEADELTASLEELLTGVFMPMELTGESLRSTEESASYYDDYLATLILYFTGNICDSCRLFEDQVLRNQEVISAFTEEMIVFIAIYVDNDRVLPMNQQYEKEWNGKIYSIKTVGDHNTLLQLEHFNLTNQPCIIIYDKYMENYDVLTFDEFQTSEALLKELDLIRKRF